MTESGRRVVQAHQAYQAAVDRKRDAEKSPPGRHHAAKCEAAQRDLELALAGLAWALGILPAGRS